jgi:hypothetical protein
MVLNESQMHEQIEPLDPSAEEEGFSLRQEQK